MTTLLKSLHPLKAIILIVALILTSSYILISVLFAFLNLFKLV